MRILITTLSLCLVHLMLGCSGAAVEMKKPLAMDKVPADILKVAQEKYPEIVFETAFTETEQGHPVYELKGKTKSGKIHEVEVTHDGKILHAQ